jgi:Gas vesicle protein K
MPHSFQGFPRPSICSAAGETTRRKRKQHGMNTMESVQRAKVECNSFSDFAKVMQSSWTSLGTEDGKKQHLNLDQDSVKNGLGQLVLTLIKLLHDLLERQAVRRMEAGTLTDPEIERLGTTLMLQAEEIERLRREFGLSEEDLNLDLGPLGKLL